MIRPRNKKKTQRQLYSPLASDIASQLYSAYAEWYSLREFRRRIEYHCKARPLQYHFCGGKNITLSKTAYGRALYWDGTDFEQAKRKYISYYD